jgi:general secretion pathway protein H
MLQVRRSLTKPSRRPSGFTLLEVLIVLALVAVLTAGVLSGTGLLGTSRERAAASLILSAIRIGMTHANSSGLPVRLVLDIDKSQIALEQTRTRMLRVQQEEDSADPSAGAAAATEAERLASEETKRIQEGPRESPPSFTPLRALGDSDEPSGARALGGDVRFVSVQTEHDPEPRDEGRAYLYFWPGGGTEKAVITLGRPEDGGEPRSIVVDALTGRAQVVKGAVDFERPEPEIDFGEREAE